MKKNRIKAYWLLLLVLLYTAAAVLSVGEAQARYVTTATWNTVVQQTEEKPTVTSDCLEAVAEADDFVLLLGTMPQEPYSVTFSLTAEEAASGKLTWTVETEYISADATENTSGEMPDFISVKMCIGENVIDQEKLIEMAAGETVKVTMILTPAEMAFTDPRAAVSVSVAVSWADTLKGTFLTQLPAVAEEPAEEEKSDEENSEEEESDKENTGDGGNSGNSGDNSGGENSGGSGEGSTGGDNTGGSGEGGSGESGENPTEATETPAETTEPPAETTEPPAEETQPTVTGFRHRAFSHKLSARSGVTPNTETSDDETVPEEETTEPVTETEPVAETEPTTETEPSTPDEPVGQADEPADPEKPAGEGENSEESSDENTGETTDPTEPVQEKPPVITIDAKPVNSAEALPVQITAPENGGAIRLGIATVIESADAEGENQTVLDTFPKYTRFRLAEGESWFMLYKEDTIALEVQAGETLSVLLDLSHVELEQLQVVLGAQPQIEEAAISTYETVVIPESARHTAVTSRVLTPDTQLEIEVSEFWKAYSLEFTVEMLTVTVSEDGKTETVEFKPAELPEDCLGVEFISDDTGTKLIFSIVGETLPPAGTYRVSLNWTFGGTRYAQSQETFFINYLAYTESEETGGAEQ